MKKLSTVFSVLAILLTNVMCVYVTYNCTFLYYVRGNSAPWWVGLFAIIPFAIGIIACSVIAYIAKKRGK